MFRVCQEVLAALYGAAIPSVASSFTPGDAAHASEKRARSAPRGLRLLQHAAALPVRAPAVLLRAALQPAARDQLNVQKNQNKNI